MVTPSGLTHVPWVSGATEGLVVVVVLLVVLVVLVLVLVLVVVVVAHPFLEWHGRAASLEGVKKSKEKAKINGTNIFFMVAQPGFEPGTLGYEPSKIPFLHRASNREGRKCHSKRPSLCCFGRVRTCNRRLNRALHYQLCYKAMIISVVSIPQVFEGRKRRARSGAVQHHHIPRRDKDGR